RDTAFDRERGAVRVRETERLDALVLAERMLPAPAGADADRAILEAVRAHGLDILPWHKESLALRNRLAWLHRGLGQPWPDMSDDALMARLDEWLAPFLTGAATLSAITPSALSAGLM